MAQTPKTETTPTAEKLAFALDMLLDVVTDKDTELGNNFYNHVAIRSAQQLVAEAKETGLLKELPDNLSETIDEIYR